MAKKKKLKKVKQATPAPAAPIAASGYDAAHWSPSRSFNFWPLSDEFADLSEWQLSTIWRRARSLYGNFSAIRKVVQTMILLQGVLIPRGNTADAEWNELARRAFLRRAMDANLFDASGRMNFFQAQRWIERRALIDGDSLTVLTFDRDGLAKCRFFAAPQIVDPVQSITRPERRRAGCILNASGKVIAYHVSDPLHKKSIRVPAHSAILYGHDPEASDPRRPSELITAITTAEDAYEINQFQKTQVKLAATFGIYETKSIDDSTPGASGLPVNGRLWARSQNQSGNASPQPPPEQPLIISGVRALSLAPGRDLKTIDSKNPSNEVRQFVKDLTDSFAHGIGLDPQICFSPESLGSASARFVLAKAKDVANKRNEDRAAWVVRIWQHIIADEIASGNLRTCRDAENMWRPFLVNRAEWSIDLGRDANSFISLENAGLADAADWTLSHYDLTPEEILTRRAKRLRQAMDIAESSGVPLDMLIPPAPGAQGWNLPENLTSDE